MTRLLTLALFAAGCVHVKPDPTVPATAAQVQQPAWRALSAEHRVTVVAQLDGGRTDTRALRGLIVVARPDRFRLRALGPAGLTLFDLVVRAGTPKIVSAIRAPAEGASGRALAEVISSLAADLACAYDLDPRAGRTVRVEGGAVIVEEPGRRVRLSRFAGQPATWRRAEIEAARYRVTVEVDHVEVDPSLDPALFDD